MNLADIQNHIFRRTKTNTSSFPVADMAIAVNNAIERVESLIRPWTFTYDFTRFTGANITTGTAAPKFRSTFHELIPLWVEYQYWAENAGSPGAAVVLNSIDREIQRKEGELERWYGSHDYKPMSVTIATPGVLTVDNHGFGSGEIVSFETSGALPTGLSAETDYYVIGGGITRDLFEVASVKDGTPITTTGSQSGSHFACVKRQHRMRVTTDSSK